MKRILLLCFALFTFISYEVIAQRTVSGTITDESGEPLPGVNVVIKGTTSGTQTDLDGNYRLSVEDGAILVFSYVGFGTQEIEVGSRTTIDIEMGGSTQLEEVVVTGYSAQSKKLLTSAVSTIGGEEMKNFAAPSFEQALQGRTAGVQVTTTSGVLGAPVNVRVRGASSINASSQPLYVIDGIPITTGDGGTDGGTIGSGFGGPGTNPLINLNPNDIASVEVLKDAAAAAIYGSRGSNGVVLITTKKGSSGKPKVSVNYYAGVQDATDEYDYMNGQEFTDTWNYAGIALFRDVFGVTQEEAEGLWFDPATNALVLGGDGALDPNNVTNTDWLDLVTRQGFVQEASASISGGSETTKYFASFTYHDEEGYIDRNELQKYNIRLNLDQEISDKVSVSLQLSPSRSENFRVGQDNAVGAPLTYAGLYYPNVEAYDEDGTPNLDFGPNLFPQFNGTPLSNRDGIDFESIITQVLATTSVSYRPIQNMTFKSQFGVDFFSLEERRRFGEETTDGWLIGAADATNDRFLNYVWTNTLNYTTDFGDHSIGGLIGSEIQKSTQDEISVGGNTFADDRLKTLNSAAEITGGGGARTEFSFAGFFTSVNYSFKQKYLLGLTARIDGSSRFGENNRYGFFPAVSAGWIISEEDFLQSGAVSFLKLRASYGRTGNAAIGNFASRGLAAFGRDYSFSPGFEPSSIENTDLTWETTDQLDAALEFGVLDDRISGSIGYYRKTTSDLLLNVPLPVETGISGTNTSTNPSILQNIGEIRNQGIEIMLNAKILDGPFSWTSSINFSTLDTEVLSLPDNDGDGVGDDIITGNNILREGEALSAFYVVQYAGVNPENGDALFAVPNATDEDIQNGNAFELNGRLVTDSYNFAANDRQISGSPFSEWYGGITNTFQFKGIDLNIFFQYDYGRDLFMSEAEFYATNLSSVWNQTRDQLDYWTPDNTDASIPEARLFTQNGSQASTRYLSDASYLRLKTLSIGYTFPESLTGDYNLRVYAQGQNLLTFDNNFLGVDPEANGDNSTQFTGDIFFSPPQPRIITVGFNLLF